MKKQIKIIPIILALSVFTIMAIGSGSSSSDDSNSGDNSISTSVGISDTNNNEEESNLTTEVNSNKQPLDVTIEEKVILEQEGIKITAKEYVHDAIWGDGIKLLIENNTAKNISISCKTLIVNNYMISDLFATSIAANKKTNETLHLSSNELNAAGIENVGQIEMYFHVFDSDDYTNVFDTDCICLKTSLYDKMDIVPNDAGTELYNENGIRIVGKYVDQNSFWGKAVLLYLENDSGQNVNVSCENMSINGFMVTPLFVSTLYNEKMAIDEISIMSKELEENDIKSIDEIELSFKIYNSDTYQTIKVTNPIQFNVN